MNAHSVGANSVSWAPSNLPGTLVVSAAANSNSPKMFASGGCDNLVKLWRFLLIKFREDQGTWKEETALAGHTDWVRDVAFAPSLGSTRTYLASCSQDKTVIIWTQDENGPWKKKMLKAEPFADVIWRVSWSIAGNILAVSCGDNKVTLWKENVDGEFLQIGDVNETN